MWEQRPAAQGDTEDWPSLTAASSSSSTPQLASAGGGIAESSLGHSIAERRPSDHGDPALAANRLEVGAQGDQPPAASSRFEDGSLVRGREASEELDWDSLVISRSQTEAAAGVSLALHHTER